MRAPLRAMTNEASAAGPHAKAAEPEDDSRRVREWRRDWRDFMSRAVIYFDDAPADVVQSYKPYFKALGSVVQLFFDSNVTHVITDRQDGDVAVKARGESIRVYSNDKLARFMNALVGYTPRRTAETGQSAKLDQLLENEKRQNTVNAAYSRKEGNFHTFRGPYLLVYDMRQVNRPLAVKEWRPSEVIEDGEWPHLRMVPQGMCPFGTRSKSSKRRQQQQQLQLQQQQQQQQQQRQQQQPELLAQAPAQAPAQAQAHAQAQPQPQVPVQAPAQGPTQVPTQVPAQVQRQVHEHDLPLSRVLTGVDQIDTRDSSYPLEPRQKRRALAVPSAAGLAELGITDAVSSGRGFGGNIFAGLAETAEDKGLKRTHSHHHLESYPRQPRNPLDPSQPYARKPLSLLPEDDKENQVPVAPRASATPSIQPHAASQQASTRLREFGEIVASGVQRYSQTSTKSFAANVGPSREVANLKRKVLPPPPATTAPPRARPEPTRRDRPAKKPGFCENCLERYEDLTEHLKSQSHVMFATNEKRFKPLQQALERFRSSRPTNPLHPSS